MGTWWEGRGLATIQLEWHLGRSKHTTCFSDATRSTKVLISSLQRYEAPSVPLGAPSLDRWIFAKHKAYRRTLCNALPTLDHANLIRFRQNISGQPRRWRYPPSLLSSSPTKLERRLWMSTVEALCLRLHTRPPVFSQHLSRDDSDAHSACAQGLTPPLGCLGNLHATHTFDAP